MKYFWHLLSLIYSKFIIPILNVKPPSLLFNKPKKKFQDQKIEIIHADINFNQAERKLILEAINDFCRFTNERIKFNLVYDYNKEKNMVYMGSLLLKSTSQDKIIQNQDEYHSIKVIGLCFYLKNGYRNIHLIRDRIFTDTVFKNTLIHELGHYIGMDHTEEYSIMNSVISNKVLYPNYIDAIELAKVWDCSPADLCYFKL